MTKDRSLLDFIRQSRRGRTVHEEIEYRRRLDELQGNAEPNETPSSGTDGPDSAGGSGSGSDSAEVESKRILCDKCSSPAHVVQEGRKLFVEGNALVGNKVNANMRRYDSRVLDEAVSNISDKIRSGGLVGHLGHQESAQGNPVAVSHVFESLTKKGSNYYGRARVIDEGSGKILGSILRAGGSVGFSSAGLAATKKGKDGVLHVQHPFRLMHIDGVLNPSTGAEGHIRGLSESLSSNTIPPNSRVLALALLTESIASQNTLTSQTLNKDKLTSKAFEIALAILAKLGGEFGHSEIVASQRRNALDWDREIMPYLDPNSRKTFLDIMEKDRSDLTAKLLKLQQQIQLDDAGIYSSNQSRFASYAKAIASTSNPIRKTQLKREAMQLVKSDRLIKESVKLLSRGGSRREISDMQNEIENIRRNAGTKLPSMENEIHAIDSYYRSRSNKRK
jgi:hypothetical protein